MRNTDQSSEYWRRNEILIAILLVIWAIVSYGFAIFFARPLSEANVGALPASFWWAQQGSIFVFVILIFVYAKVMDRLDRRYDLQDEED